MADTFLLRVHAKNCNLEALNTFRGSLVSFTHRQLRAPDALHYTLQHVDCSPVWLNVVIGFLQRRATCAHAMPSHPPLNGAAGQLYYSNQHAGALQRYDLVEPR
jgi:hypothetical protein